MAAVLCLDGDGDEALPLDDDLPPPLPIIY